MREHLLNGWVLGCLAVLTVAVVVNVPALDFGWFGDDYVHRRFILDHLHGVPSRVAFWNMFDWRDLANRDQVDAGSLFGRLPWWAAPEFSFALLRPLSTLSHFADYVLWPESPWLMHLHNVVLYGIAVSLAAHLYRRMFAEGLWALVPTLLFAIDDAHVVSTAWIASRNTLLTAVFVLLTLLSYVQSTEARSRTADLRTSFVLLFAHACSEGATVVWAYLLAYALTIDARPHSERLRSLLPSFFVSVSVLVVSALLGYGVRGSAVYVDPRSAPGLFVSMVGPRLLDLLRLQLGLPPELSQAWPGTLGEVAQLTSSCYLLMLPVLVLVYRASAHVRFFALASVLALLPQCAAGSFSRLLLLSGFAAHGLLFSLGCELVSSASRAVWSRFIVVGYACITLAFHGAAALDGPRHALAFSRIIDRSVSVAASSLPAGRDIADERLIVLNFPDYLRSVFIDVYRRELNGPGPRYMDVLGVTPARVQLTRRTHDEIELMPDGGYLLEPSTMLVRTPSDVFQPGGRYTVSNLDLEVVSVTPDGRPAAVRVSGPEVVDESTRWFRWNALEQRFVRMRLPPVGSSVWLDTNAYDLPPG